MTNVALVRLEYSQDRLDSANEHIGIGYLASMLSRDKTNIIDLILY